MSCRCEEMKNLKLVDFLVESAESYRRINDLAVGVLPELLNYEALMEIARKLKLKVEIIPATYPPKPEGLDVILKNKYSEKIDEPVLVL